MKKDDCNCCSLKQVWKIKRHKGLMARIDINEYRPETCLSTNKQTGQKRFYKHVSLFLQWKCVTFCSSLQNGSVSIQQLPSWAPHALKYPTKSYRCSPIKHFLNTPRGNQSECQDISWNIILTPTLWNISLILTAIMDVWCVKLWQRVNLNIQTIILCPTSVTFLLTGRSQASPKAAGRANS